MRNTAIELRLALQRILRGKPNDPNNSKITQASVAREAGHTRTLISGEKCAYPSIQRLITRVRRRIDSCGNKSESRHVFEGEQESAIRGQSLEQVNARLRKRIIELESDVQMFATLLAEADQQLRINSQPNERKKHDDARKAARTRRRGSR